MFFFIFVFVFHFLVWWFRFLFLFFICFCFIDEGWVGMTVHIKKGAMPLAFGCGLGGEGAVVNLGFLGGCGCRPDRDLCVFACYVLYQGC